jgi:hypothetical protein
VYLNCLCTCSAVLGATDDMDECYMRAIGNMSLSTCVSFRFGIPLWGCPGKGKRGGGDLRT